MSDIRDALIGLDDAINLYFKEGRTDGQVKNICYWLFKGKEALKAHAIQPQRDTPPWWKILADNWRGRNGNSTTGDSVRNSCADELEKVAASHALTRPECGDAT